MSKIWIVCLLLILAGCKNKKAALSGDVAINAEEFFSAFPILNLPFNASDTNIAKIGDTTRISYTVISSFIPDTALAILANKDIKKTIFRPVGKIEKANELYILVNGIENKQTELVCFLFDKKYHFLRSLELLDSRNEDNYRHFVTINNEPTFIISREKIVRDKLLFTKTGYAYNKEAANFIPVVSDGNEDFRKKEEIINPIDTFLRKNKYSGDYVQDKKNFISIRDGNKASEYLFFIHFEKNNGECTGELKGELKITAENKAIFSQAGDPCILDFIFSKTRVKVKERGSCGSHRGIQCFFDDSFVKKKEEKAVVHSSKKK